MNKQRQKYKKVAFQNNNKKISNDLQSFKELAMLIKKNEREKSRNKELRIIENFSSTTNSVKSTIKDVSLNTINTTSNFNRKLMKFKKNPKRFFKDSKYIFLRPLQYLYKDQK